MKVIEYNGRRYACTLTDRFRRHSAEEREVMRESLSAPRGLLNPVRLYDDDDLEVSDCVLDGEGRLELCVELGLGLDWDTHFVHMGRMGTEAAYELARSFNDARRQDDPQAVRRRRAERVAAKRAGGKSLRRIADEEGVSKAQVERDLQVSPPGTPEPAEVVGRDGKTYPAARPEPEPEQDEEVPPPSDPGVPARKPPKHFKPGNAVDPDHPFAGLLNRIRALTGDVSEAMNGPGGDRLKRYLSHVRLVDHFAKLVPGGRSAKPKYVGLRDLYRVVKLAGLPGKEKTEEQLVKELQKAEGDE